MQPISNSLGPLPVYTPEQVWHVGTLNPADKNMHGSSQEGTGLSVSECPEDWCYIVRLGGHPTWEFTRKDAQFLDFFAMTEPQQAALLAWALEKNYVEMQDRFKFSYFDCESECDRFQMFDTREDAEYEATEYEDAPIEVVSVPCPTQAMHDRLGFKAEPIGVMDLVATFYVEDETELDGVWWFENYAPELLSAPRGVIVPRRLEAWTRTAAT